MFEIKDLTGLGKPLTKLMDVASKGLGVLWRPQAIRREADARAYEIQTIAKAQANAEVTRRNIDIDASLSRIQEISTVNPELAERARQRLLIREVEGQKNLEAVVEQAYVALPLSVSEAPVNETWRRKFFQEAENVCDEDMQLLWGKILAGEVSSPGTYSLRTLSVLRELSAHEAETFRTACSIAMSDGSIAIPGDDLNSALVPFGIAYGDLIRLRDAGLMTSGDSLKRTYKSPSLDDSDGPKFAFLSNNGISIQLSVPPGGLIQFPTVLFTSVGRELQRLMSISPNQAYFSALGNFWRIRSINAKRSSELTQSEGVVAQTFEQDL
ncbi:DUF2806 domain-containing protein [Rhodoferax saidenbachensis]|uniref:DUF2806 domain-containing protein n=1 Tax=Rhodoferax saidenbachensis TaxID=1484693 RepID=UPI001378428B|nr:DUF2806 domain-containing protein [Rhodoferax saidenbachensis]